MGGRIGANPIEWFKAIYSTLLLIFCVVIVMALIFDEKTMISQKVHPAFAFILIWFCLFALSIVEGGQASVVGLPPIDKSLYKESHPIAHRICVYHHKGDNLDRYIMGRQFLVLVCVFVINSCGAPLADAEVLHLPFMITKIFLKSGLAMILFTCMIGQLQTEVNATLCMLDFLNNWPNFIICKVAMVVEASGLLHSAYVFQMLVAWLAGKKIESNEPPRSLFMNFLFWIRVLGSTALLVFSWVVTMVALFTGKSTVWPSVPEIVALILFLILMGVVGTLEGIQISYFCASKLTAEERNFNYWAKLQCDLLFSGDGQNFPSFMVGRQLCIVSCFFIIARVTSMEIKPGQTNVLGLGRVGQSFCDTGLLGAFITTIVASISWRLLASAFPLGFMSTPFTYVLLRLCLYLERTGICMGAFVLAAIQRKLFGFQRDEVYVGTAEERAALNLKDKDYEEAGHLVGSAFPGGAGLDMPMLDFDVPLLPSKSHEVDYSEKRAKILANIQVINEQKALAVTEEEAEIFRDALHFEMSALRRLNTEEGKTHETKPHETKPHEVKTVVAAEDSEQSTAPDHE